MKDIANNLRKSYALKIQLTITINYSKGTNEECAMNSKRNNIEIVICDKTDQVTEKLFKSVLARYQMSFEESIKSCNFIFDYVKLL